MLERQMECRSDSWAMRWYWSVFNCGGSVLFPPVTLVRNSGLGGSGTHGRGWLKRFQGGASLDSAALPDLLLDIVVRDDDFAALRRAYWRQSGDWAGRAIDVARRLRSSLARKILDAEACP
jgi:hypothetical protein